MHDTLTRNQGTKKQVIRELTEMIVERAGLEVGEARDVVEGVHKEFSKQQAEARAGLLKDMQQTLDPRIPKSKLQKLIEATTRGSSKSFGVSA